MKTKAINSCMWWGAITVLTLLTHAQAGVVNGTFDKDLTGWTQIPATGGLLAGNNDWVWDSRPTHGGVAMSDDGDNWWGGLEQTVTVAAGQPYYLSFDYDFVSGSGWVDNGALTYSVLENGDFLLGPTPVADRTGFDILQTFGGSFVPAGNQVTLRFMNSYADAANEGASGSDQAFDNVTLVMVPEPSSTATLASLLLIGIAGFRARRRTV